MPFSPPRLLVAYDDADGLCPTVVPRLVELLEDRAFQVEEHVIGDRPESLDLYGYQGLVVGTPSYGLGLRGAGPSERVQRFIEAQEDLDEVRVAVFCVYKVRPGNSLRNTRQLVRDRGGEVVCTFAYSKLRPEHDEHVLPAECMVRIR
ncbi:MAG TPA: hypothetical protein QGF58_10630 [Myxococcota bacterium]|nr:hypothetical protein [Myxococcota bacterium]